MKMINIIIYYAYFFYYRISILIESLHIQDDNHARIVSAKLFALLTHHRCGQRYDNNLPYYWHLNMVFNFTQKFKILTNDEKCVAGIIALNHDIIEDCRKTYNDVKTIFGDEVANGVYACTELRGKNRKERHGPEYLLSLKENKLGLYVKLCDIISNMTRGQMTGSRMLEMYIKEYKKTKEELYRIDFNELFGYLEINFIND